MIGGIVTLLALLSFLSIVVYVFIIKRREDFDEQAQLPLAEDDSLESNHRETRS